MRTLGPSSQLKGVAMRGDASLHSVGNRLALSTSRCLQSALKIRDGNVACCVPGTEHA